MLDAFEYYVPPQFRFTYNAGSNHTTAAKNADFSNTNGRESFWPSSHFPYDTTEHHAIPGKDTRTIVVEGVKVGNFDTVLFCKEFYHLVDGIKL